MDGLKHYFKKIHCQLDASFNRSLRNYGLTSAQFDILDYLARHTETQNTLTDISAYLGVKHTSAIHVLKILEKKGFIAKTRSPDARSKAITLTGAGRQAIAGVMQKAPLVSRIMLAGLSDSELELLEKMLDKIDTNLQSDAFRNL